MSQGILSSSYLYSTKFNLPTQNPIFETCSSSYLTFDSSHHPTLSFSLKTQSGSCRSRPIMACMSSSSLYVTAESSSLYELLGISERGTQRDIKQAYKQLVLKYHPDVSPPECVQEYTNKFIRIQEAYETLSDPNSRALYDSDFARGLHMAFSARKQFHQYKGLDLDVRGEWKRQWETQLKELKRRRMNRDSRNNMSCGARMRRD